MASPPRESTPTKLSDVVENVEDVPRRLKTTANGIVLVPQPSDDPKDPLNWPMRKKLLNLSIIVLASFACDIAAVANAASVAAQAATYNKSLVAISYSISASVAGLAAGPLIWTPLARKFGKCLLIFWTMLVLLGTSIWAALCTKEDDYISFIMSRTLGGLFGSASITLGAGLIIETFYLHQRGKCFTVYSIVLLVGTVAGPTFSGFIVAYSSWPVEYWYNVGLEVLTLILIPLCLSETGFTRPGGPIYPPLPENWVQDRIATYITGSVTPHHSWGQVIAVAGSQFAILASPVSLLAGGYLFVMFAWPVAVNTLLGVFLQTPVELGGYGFTPEQNSYFLFTSWIAIVVAEVYGHLVVDRFALYLCKRFNKGAWKPEYRLHSLWVPGLILMPVGLGIFGAALHQHYHPVVLALGLFGLVTASVIAVPVLDTYVVECFTTRAAEANAVMNGWRISFGLTIPFFISPWIAKVGVNWVFGSMAFFSILAFGCILALMVAGHTIRGATFGNTGADEEGIAMTVSDQDPAHDQNKA